MSTHLFLGAASFFLAVALSGCASGGQPSAPSCRSDLPFHGESLNAFADSAQLQEELERFWPSSTDLILANFYYDSVGVLDTIGVWVDALPADPRRRIEETLFASARREGVPEERVSLFLGDHEGPRVRRVEGFRTCRPSLLHPESLSREVGREGRALGLAEKRTAVLRAYVTRVGTAQDVRVVQSSGDLRFDVAAAGLIQSAQFLPARLEGIPVPLWAQFPVTYTPSGRED